MPKNVKLGVLRILNADATGNTSSPIPDDACLQMLMTNDQRTSILNYWSDNTEGYLDFTGTHMLPWATITVENTDLAIDKHAILRKVTAQLAVKAVQDAHGANCLDGLDGLVVIVHPGAPITIPHPTPGQGGTYVYHFDAGADDVLVKHRALPMCVLPTHDVSHTFMCHELGHVLGFTHSFGVSSLAGDQDGNNIHTYSDEYGDPYDIMSGEAFGWRQADGPRIAYTSTPFHSRTTLSDWPNTAANSRMGPAPSRAHVHFWDAQAFPAHSTQYHPTLPSSAPFKARLFAATGPRSALRLIVIQTSTQGRCYIEYRDAKAWDQGLDTIGDDLARRAVVVHTIDQATDGHMHSWYRGRILVPLEIESDLQVAGSPLNVRVISANPDMGYVDIEVTTSKPQGLYFIETTSDRVAGPIGPTESRTTPCGDTVTWGTWATESQHGYQPLTHGFGGDDSPDTPPPTIGWTVGGIPLNPSAGTGSVSVNTLQGGFSLRYSINPSDMTLTLTSQPGDQYDVPIVATASEAGSPTVSHTAMFSPKGRYEGYQRGDLIKIVRCTSRVLLEGSHHELVFDVPKKPDITPQVIVEGATRAVIHDALSASHAQTTPVPTAALRRLSRLLN